MQFALPNSVFTLFLDAPNPFDEEFDINFVLLDKGSVISRESMTIKEVRP